ncbi:MAG TPA: hypothetical protein PL151_03240 [Phycisphaerae bacterium]|nr:hypothetical protein [Phycisphaerae bacterium]HOJ75415.1 hypothetical protein [Phycisphaerae bacterium]HOM49634.1 hypothetical protein [Phycisphaerae bacterium]HON68886.1 hypothetical protein [Phycisphaerae bacterium]HOQ84109.1 hypothetical protein [Phycisphaerae bacterium]
MPNKLARREFVKGSAVAAAAFLAQSKPARSSSGTEPAEASADTSYRTSWYPFTGHPHADSCWSLSVGPDGRIYAAACSEHMPGGVVKVVRYNEQTDALDYLFTLDEMVDDPHDSGRATQCKIHYSFVPSMSDGVLYMATHLSGPPIDQPAYSPWRSWHDEKRCFRGSALLAFDTKTDRVLWWDTLIPKEGCRCLLHDEERHLLYALSYPRDHFIIFDTRTRTRRDLGRIGSVNAQALFLDRRRRVWTTDDYGHLVRYDPEIDRLDRSPFVLPHDPEFQTGWHSVFYDVVAAPDGECVYAVTWIAAPRLMRIWPNEGDWPRVEDLGPVTQKRNPSIPKDTFVDHCGGLVFGGDRQLYYVASRWRDPVYNPMPADRPAREGVVWRLDPATLERTEVAVLKHPTDLAQYVSRGAVDRNGDLFFGNVGTKPVGIFKLHMPADRRIKNAHLPIRIWG